MPGTLYIVATPIGNLGDISPRAAKTLRAADLIAAEDTRNTLVLTRHLGIDTRLVAHHKFNQAASADGLIALLREGKDIALVTDAGTPCISDPGHLLVRAAAAAGIEVIGVPGPCAVITALSLSGFDGARYAFIGFLPKEPKALRGVFTRIAGQDIPVWACYESPLRIAGTMEMLAEILPGTAVCLCNDLTKRFERVYRGTPREVLEQLRENPAAHKGEYTLVLEKPQSASAATSEHPDETTIEARLVDIMVRSGVTLREAVTALHRVDTGLTRRAIYAASLRLRKMNFGGGETPERG